MKRKTKMSLGDLNKSNVWTVTPAELSQMIIDAKKKRDEYAEVEKHFKNIVKPVFDIQYLRRDDTNSVNKFESLGFSVFSTPDENGNNAIAIRKHPIKKITDLTLENIQHLEAWEVLELIKNNMGTGWKGLPLAIQDIIEQAFFVDCTVMPEKTMHKAGGIVDRRKEDGYEVLEIVRGTWIEGVFMKPKPKMEKMHIDYAMDEEEDSKKKHHRTNDEDGDFDEYDDIPEEEEEDEDMDEEELKKLDGNDYEDDIDEDIIDEDNIEIEDIDNLEDIEDVDDEE
ncbi:MAG: hypothetical protein UDK36_03150 [Bacteroidaceae bacterium]|nr:hypothetical protein [Bacteroidaceae bacterium]